jgi:hypothetical protein
MDKSAVCIFDETNICSNSRGATTFSVQKADEKQYSLVMICVSGSNHKFPVKIIFKGKDTSSGKIYRKIRQIEPMVKVRDIRYWRSLLYKIKHE